MSTGSVSYTHLPLLKACDAVSKAGVRFVRMFGNTEAKKVRAYVGPEQEYFIVNREKYLERPDLIYAGRTLFGAPAPKGQEMEDQYFGPLKTKIADFMADVDEQLWKLGITVKTQHLSLIHISRTLSWRSVQVRVETRQPFSQPRFSVCMCIMQSPEDGKLK